MKSGSVVKLKGHDWPVMTVRWVREGTVNQHTQPVAVTCEWFDSNIHLQQHEFKPETLELVNER